MRHKHHSPKYYAAFKFTSDAAGQTFVFKNKFNGRIYSFELLDCVSEPVARLDAQLIEEYHLKPQVAVEQIWCRIKPDFDGNSLAIGFDEVFTDLYTEEADGPVAFGIQLGNEKKFDGNVFTGSTLKPTAEDKIVWKLEVFDSENNDA